MSILNRVLPHSSYGEAEGLQYKHIDLSNNTGRGMDWYVNNQNDFHEFSSKLEMALRYETNNPLKEIAVWVERRRNMNEKEFSLINRKVREQKLRIQYFSLLENINSLHEESEEEGYEVFSEIAKITAKNVLYYVCCKFPDNEYFIYPTEDREIAIDCNPMDKRGVLILCDSNGGIACFVTIDGKNSSFRDEKCSEFFYNFLWRSFKRVENTYYPNKIHDFSNIPTMDNSEYVLKSLAKTYRPVKLSSTAKVAI